MSVSNEKEGFEDTGKGAADHQDVPEKREETVAEKVEKIRRFTGAGQLFLSETPELRQREKARKKAFRSEPWSKYAKDVRTHGGTEPLLRSGGEGSIGDFSGNIHKGEDKQRASYFARSYDENPGPLSKFGDGDGSFFDSWLTNTRFHAPQAGAIGFKTKT
jgi:hypothetical protein